MSEQDIRNMKILDELAEKAGGYVADPSKVKHSKKLEEDFRTMRQYCVKHKKKFTELTEQDYDEMGIRPF